ncbi:hypothetical protein [Nannocystis pusilla]|uniref:hypothetical protein n=1 Tax=Nannocystis pusilla TaxID=889268 RepID=UPI003DA301FF
MSHRAPCLLLVVAACTSAEPRPLRPLELADATSPWQERCGRRVWAAAAEAGDQRLAGAAVSFAELHGDNFVYYAVTLRGAAPEGLVLHIDRKHLPLADEHADGWRREVIAARTRWRREDGITRAELERPRERAAGRTHPRAPARRRGRLHRRRLRPARRELTSGPDARRLDPSPEHLSAPRVRVTALRLALSAANRGTARPASDPAARGRSRPALIAKHMRRQFRASSTPPPDREPECPHRARFCPHTNCASHHHEST